MDSNQQQPTIITEAVTSPKQVQTTPPQEPLDTPLEAKPEAKEHKKEDAAKKFAIISRKEKELRLKELALKEKEAALAKYKDLDKEVSSNPLKLLEKTGLTLDQLLEAAAKDGEAPTADDKITAIEKRIEAYLQSVEEEKQTRLKADEESKKQQELKAQQEVIDSFKKNIENELKAKADEFELIIGEGAFDLVFEVINEHFEKTGDMMQTEVAASKVENYLEEQASKYLKYKKLSGKLSLEQTPQKTPSMPTLNSAMSPKTEPPKDRPKSREERLAEAAKLLKWS